MRDPGDGFDAFVAASGPRLLRVAYLLTGDRQAAEDLLQDALERVLLKWARVQEPLPYTRQTLTRLAANRWRRRSTRPEVTLGHHDRAVGDGADGRAVRDELVRALAALPPRQRAVVVLRYLEDLSERETAAALDCSVGTVKSQASRALARLRASLTDIDDALTLGRVP